MAAVHKSTNISFIFRYKGWPKTKKKIFFNDALQLLHVTSEESTTADALTRDSSITGMGNLFSRRELHETWPITEWDTPLK